MAAVAEELERLRSANAQAIELLNRINTQRKQGALPETRKELTPDQTVKEQFSENVKPSETMDQINEDCRVKGQNSPLDIWGCQDYLYQSDRLSFVRQYLKSAQDVIDKNSKLIAVTKPASYEVVEDVDSLLNSPSTVTPRRQSEPIFPPQSSPSTARTDRTVPQLDVPPVIPITDISLTEHHPPAAGNQLSLHPALSASQNLLLQSTDANDIPDVQFSKTKEGRASCDDRAYNETEFPSTSNHVFNEYIHAELTPKERGHIQCVDELFMEDDRNIAFHDQNTKKTLRRPSLNPPVDIDTFDATYRASKGSAKPEFISLLLEMDRLPNSEAIPKKILDSRTKAAEKHNGAPNPRGSAICDTSTSICEVKKADETFKFAPREAFVSIEKPALIQTVDDTHIKLRHIKGKILKLPPREDFPDLKRPEKRTRDPQRNGDIINQPRNPVKDEQPIPLFTKRADTEWDLLPDEMVVHIFSYLANKDLKQMSLVNRRFHRIAKDSYLWQTITANGIEIDNQWLERVESGKVKHVHLHKCSSKWLQSRCLRAFFQNCRHSLQSIHVSECRHDSLSGDNILLHVSSRCDNVWRISIPWSNASNNGISALASSNIVLKELDISGNGSVGDEAFIPFVTQKGHALQTLKVSGCFALTNDALTALGQHCSNLEVLHIGMCAKVTADCVTTLCASLGKLRSVDFRGLKSVTDQCLVSMSKNCKSLTDVVLANCSHVTDRGIIELTSELTTITHLDVSGCPGVTDSSVTAMAFCLSDIQSLNISNTGISYLSVDALTEHCLHCLQTLKISFCSNITNECVKRLVSFCYNLRCLHIHGCKRVKTGNLLSNTSNCLEICF